MLTMGIEHYDQPHAVFFILEVSNAFFTTVFGLGKFLFCLKLLYYWFFLRIFLNCFLNSADLADAFESLGLTVNVQHIVPLASSVDYKAMLLNRVLRYPQNVIYRWMLQLLLLNSCPCAGSH